MKLKRISPTSQRQWLRVCDDVDGEVAQRRKEDTNAGTERRSKKDGGEGGGGGRKTGTFAYMVTDYRGTKGRRALGPLFLEETRRSFSLPRRHPSPRLLRVPCSELLITFACISPLLLPLARSSRCSSPPSRLFFSLSRSSLLPSLAPSRMHYAFEDRVITVDYAVAHRASFSAKEIANWVRRAAIRDSDGREGVVT